MTTGHTGLDLAVSVYRWVLRIGALAARAGTSARALRYYEQLPGGPVIGCGDVDPGPVVVPVAFRTVATA